MGMTFDNGPFNQDEFMCKEFLRIRDTYGIDTVIELGTFHGVTSKWLAQHFARVVTIEIVPQYYAIAQAKNLRGLRNVEAIQGSSVDKLPGILQTVSNKTLMFIDSHWFENPMQRELQIISESGVKPFLAIHDFFVPGKSDINKPTGRFGFDIYPEQRIVYDWDFVANGIEAIYGEDGYNKYYNEEVSEDSAQRGCLFVYPKEWDENLRRTIDD